MESLFNYKSDLFKHDDIGFSFFGTRVRNPDISIMIPTYKRAHLLIYAISSVLAQRTEYSFEIVVIDNDDTGDTSALDVVKRLNDQRICYFKNDKNIGMIGNWNRCILLSKAPWIVILNDDDELAPGYIQRMLTTANSLLKCEALCCGVIRIDKNGDVIKKKNKILRRFSDLKDAFKRSKVRKLLLKDQYVPVFLSVRGCLISKKAAVYLLGFNETFFPASDMAFITRIASIYNVYCIGEDLYRYRFLVNDSLKAKTVEAIIRFNSFMSEEILRFFKKRINWWDKFFLNCKIDSEILFYQDILKDKNRQIYLKNECSKLQTGSRVRAFIYQICRNLYQLYFWI